MSAKRHKHRRGALLVAAATAAGLLGALVTGPAAVASPTGASVHPATRASDDCRLANGIKHVINIQFDNVHFTRDNPNVPSDLEQMPNLLDFIENNGTLLTDAHDDLVHTATNFTSNQTGLYPDRTSVTQSNSFDYFDSTGATHSGVSFAYWTDPLYDPSGKPADTNYNMDYTADRAAVPTTQNIDAPAPWVPYTRAGCDVGDVGMANTVLENIATDIPTVFGANSPEAAEAAADPAKATADFVGLAVHCAAASTLCANGQTDSLPDEPGGYQGYKALFGNAEVQPAVNPSGPFTDQNGAVITDDNGNVGFPGFDSLTPDVSLAYTADLLKHGVAVTNTYISDVHGDHTAADTGDLGPGEQTYEDQLHAYDQAFGTFLSQLAAAGITPANSLFDITTDEGDHFSGSAPTPSNCTGLNGNYCTYATRSEVNVNLTGLLASQDQDTTAYAIHSDPAPSFWVEGNPAPSAPAVRTLERQIGALTVANPLTGATDKVANYLADPVEEKILHFVGPDAARTASFTAFSGEDEYIGGGAANCTKPCVYTSQGYAWNHGGIWPDMTDIWLGLVGPGIRNRGVDTTTWVDQTDSRPTIMALTGLRDDYQVDGRVLTEDMTPAATPPALRHDEPQLQQLGEVYKQLLASDGQFAKETLVASTRGLESGSATDDSVYTSVEAQLTALDNHRDQLSDRISDVLLGAAFDRDRPSPWDVQSLIQQGQALLCQAQQLAG
jgi:hypothetical protein